MISVLKIAVMIYASVGLVFFTGNVVVFLSALLLSRDPALGEIHWREVRRYRRLMLLTFAWPYLIYVERRRLDENG